MAMPPPALPINPTETSAGLIIKINNQENVTAETFMAFARFLHASGFLLFAGDLNNSSESAHVSYFFYDEDSDQEQEEEAEIHSLEDIESFIKNKQLEYCSISIEGIHKAFETEFSALLQ